MKHALIATVWALLCATAVASPDNTDAAEKAAREWLAQLDAGHYQRSWERASQSFRRQIAQRPWAKVAEAVREPLGQLQQRELLSAEPRRDPPQAPPGEYVVLRFESTFSERGPVVETVTPQRTDDGWKVSGYYLR